MGLGAAELRSRNATVNVRSAWRAHPPVDLSGIAQKPIEPALPDVAPLEPRRDVAALEQLAAQRPQDPIALANLGTAHLADGRPRQALELYAKALPHASKTQAIDIHLDAALAAFASKDRAAFDEHSVAALHAGAADRLSALARTGPRE